MYTDPDDLIKSQSRELVDWENPPCLADLKEDYNAAKPAHEAHINEVNRWLNVRNGVQHINAKPGRSKLIPKLARKQAEWRYSALAEPFLSTEDIFNTAPVTHKDKEAATQSGMVLNYQFNNRINKTSFIDEYIHTAVDEGTVIVRIDWEYEEEVVTEEQPIVAQIVDPITQQLVEQPTGKYEEVEVTKIIKNQPVLTICDFNNILIDPTCQGNLDKANFIIERFETSLSELRKDSRYKNLDRINIESSNVLNESDHFIHDDSNFQFKDKARRKIVAREYWGYWDIYGSGKTEPFVATWVGDTLIRLEVNPYPDKKVPYVAVQYLPRRKNIYGEPDAALLEDNQKIIGAVSRGVMDILGRSANGQQGIRKDALDTINAKKFERGEDYKFNANVNADQAFRMERYPEIPRSALEVITMQNNEAESLTGVKAFSSDGISGKALGNTATGIRSALDATSKRELNILRRLSTGLTQIGRKIMAMNAEFLEDEEVIRITDEEFVTITRDDLAGYYDVKLDISTAEADEQKARELSFMLQTMGNSMPVELSQIVLADIARLRKMPRLSHEIKTFQPQPDPLAEEKARLELELLKAKIANEHAKSQENYVDVQLKQAKAESERAKARNAHSDADNKDLTFVERESGVDRAHEEHMNNQRHAQEMHKKEYDRIRDLDSKGFDKLTNTTY